VREAEVVPGPKATAEEIRELARLASASFGHPAGTCKMGVDKLPTPTQVCERTGCSACAWPTRP